MLDWSKGYSASYYMARVDPSTWRDVGRIEITGGSIKRDDTGLMQSADIDCINYPQGVEQWIRIYLDASQSGDKSHEPLFTGLATSPSRNINGFRVNSNVECYSVLKPADDVILPRGWYAGSGLPGAVIVKQLLSVCPCPVIIEGDSPSLMSDIIAEDGETNLTMVERILTAINRRLLITGYGIIYITQKADKANPIYDMNPLGNDIIETEISISSDWYDCPNVLMAASENVTAIARDESADSILSIQKRGREVWRYESNCDLAKDETISEYAVRRLNEAQKTQLVASYDRRYVPGIYPSDIIRVTYPAQGLNGVYQISSQDIELGYGAKTSEEIISV